MLMYYSYGERTIGHGSHRARECIRFLRKRSKSRPFRANRIRLSIFSSISDKNIPNKIDYRGSVTFRKQVAKCGAEKCSEKVVQNCSRTGSRTLRIVDMRSVLKCLGTPSTKKDFKYNLTPPLGQLTFIFLQNST